METAAILLDSARSLRVETVLLKDPADEDAVVEIRHSGISTGTEKLFWTGEMPPFPGMGYPLVPGYESLGEVVEAGSASGLKVGQTVFVPGADCYREVRGLFGGAARRVVVKGARVQPVDPMLGEEGALLALAATARHAIAGLDTDLPELIVGHGVLGRLIARLVLVAGGPPPTVWEISADRRGDAEDYPVIHPDDDPRRDYKTIFDVTGKAALLDSLIGRLAPGGEVVLAGFYPEPVQFSFPQAFMKEARLRIAAEWKPEDLAVTAMLVAQGDLSLSGLITHRASAADAPQAYQTAFSDPACLKMILDWKGVQ